MNRLIRQYDADGSGFVHGGSGPLTVYSNDEKAAIDALTDADDDTYYLFLVSSVTKLDADGNNTVVSGYMPVGYQHGFIFEQFDVARTIAHELSHGAFALHHTFSANTESFHADEGTTNNLMDYTEHGTTLNHKQWSWMHEKHGAGLFGFLADESEGEKISRYPIFNDEDLNLYKKFIKELKQFPFFEERIYKYLDESEEYFTIYDEELTIQKINNLPKNTNGYFDPAKEVKILFFTTDAGDSHNPHKIVLFSALNENLAGTFKGNGFKSTATIFEEFFHAAHYLYLKRNGIYDESSFLTITEAEVELAQAFTYYKMSKSKSKYPNATQTGYDQYGMLSSFYSLLYSVFDKISFSENQTIISKDDFDNMVQVIKEITAKKKKIYPTIDETILNTHNYEFIKYFLNINVNEKE